MPYRESLYKIDGTVATLRRDIEHTPDLTKFMADLVEAAAGLTEPFLDLHVEDSYDVCVPEVSVVGTRPATVEEVAADRVRRANIETANREVRLIQYQALRAEFDPTIPPKG